MDIAQGHPRPGTLVLVNGRWIVERRRPGRPTHVSPALIRMMRSANRQAPHDPPCGVAADQASSRSRLQNDLLYIGIGIILGTGLFWGVLLVL